MMAFDFGHPISSYTCYKAYVWFCSPDRHSQLAKARPFNARFRHSSKHLFRDDVFPDLIGAAIDTLRADSEIGRCAEGCVIRTPRPLSDNEVSFIECAFESSVFPIVGLPILSLKSHLPSLVDCGTCRPSRFDVAIALRSNHNLILGSRPRDGFGLA